MIMSIIVRSPFKMLFRLVGCEGRYDVCDQIVLKTTKQSSKLWKVFGEVLIL